MRILHVIGNLGLGGANGMLCKVVTAMRAQRPAWRHKVVTLMPRDVFEADLEGVGCETASLGMRRGGLPGLATIHRLAREIAAFDPDLLHGWMYHGNLAASLGATLAARGRPVLWSIRHSLHTLADESRMTRLLIRLGGVLSRGPHAILYNAGRVRAQHESAGYHAARGRVIPNGFDLDRFRPDPEARHALRAELGVAPGECLVGYVSRFNPFKGHREFITAAGRFMAGVGADCPAARFLFVGPDGELPRDTVRGWIAEAGLDERFLVLDRRRAIESIYRALDLYCSPSLGEAFSNCIGEAMATGVPCVVTDVGDSAWIVGETGLVVPPGDPAALAEAWRQAFQWSETERRRRSADARARVQATFSIDAVVEAYASVYAATARTDPKGRGERTPPPAAPFTPGDRP